MAILQALFCVCVSIPLGLQVLNSHVQPDYFMTWAAHHVEHPYDAVQLSRALGESWATSYYAYPPTYLFLTTAFALVSGRVGLLAWLSASAIALTLSLRRPLAPLVLAAPCVFLSWVNGQTSMVMGALLFAAFSVRGRPRLAGFFLGLAICIKPQAVVLAPLIFIGSRQWPALVSAAVTGLALSFAATLLYGPGIWFAWLGSLPGMLKAANTYFSHRHISLPGWWRIPALLIGAATSVLAGVRGKPVAGATAAVAFALLGSLHALDYDEAILAPFALVGAVEGARRRDPIGGAYIVALVLPPSIGAVLLVAAASTVESLILPASPGR
jgi:uncharacterized membrane protein